MNKLTIEERVHLVKAFYKCGESSIGALTLYNTDKDLKNFICLESTVQKLIQRFEETGNWQVSRVTRADLQSTFDNLEPHLCAVLQEEGGHFEHWFSS